MQPTNSAFSYHVATKTVSVEIYRISQVYSFGESVRNNIAEQISCAYNSKRNVLSYVLYAHIFDD